MIVGYARVSTDGQTLDAQQAALKAAGAEKVYSEKISGAVTERKALAKAIAALAAGDVLLVTRCRNAGEALIEIGRSYNVSHSTISRLASG